MNLDNFDDKPWKKPGADITDYFNFGFNEEIWKAYTDKQKMIRSGQMGQLEDMSMMIAAMTGGMMPMMGGQAAHKEGQKASSKKRRMRPMDDDCIIDLGAAKLAS